MDESHVSMTTRLRMGRPLLPFNRGRGGAGNGYRQWFRVAYLYADQPEGHILAAILLDIVGQFVHLNSTGREESSLPPLPAIGCVAQDAEPCQTTRFRAQLSDSALRRSQEVDTIAWTRILIALHNEADKAVFDTVIIVTDRVVLDRPVQNTVAQFEQVEAL